MKQQLSILAMLPTVLALAHSASASVVLYNNGPVSTLLDSYSINNGYVVSNSFILTGASTITGANFGVWTDPGDKLSSVDWTISSGSLGTGTVYGMGTAAVSNAFIIYASKGAFTYDVNTASFSIPTVSLAGGPYFFTLGNAVTADSGHAYWDRNDGPSTAFQNREGRKQGSEAFQILGDVTDVTVPEPSPTASLALGLAALGGLMVFARKRGNAAA